MKWLCVCCAVLATSSVALTAEAATEAPDIESTMNDLEVAETWSTIHGVLGYASLAVSTGSVIVGLADYASTPHVVLEYSSLGLMLSTMLVGYLTHYERMPLANPERSILHPDTIHVVLGIGGVGMTVAAFLVSDRDVRNALRIGSTVCLAVSIAMEWK